MTSSPFLSSSPGRRRSSIPHIVQPTTQSFHVSVLPSSDAINIRGEPPSLSRLSSNTSSYGAIDSNINCQSSRLLKTHDEDEEERRTTEHVSFIDGKTTSFTETSSDVLMRKPLLHQQWQCIERAASQIPAILLVTLFHLMVGIPFGVSYFPIGWESSLSVAQDDVSSAEESDGDFILEGSFPIQGKEALGIRMFLFSTIIGQVVMTYASSFNNCIALQMVENVPFCQALTYIVIEKQGYGKEALSTLFFLFGLASVIVGLVFYILGKFQLGKVLYFFPAHVLVGCIGGIGIFIAKTGLEVTANTSFSFFDITGFEMIMQKFHLLVLVFGFEAGLRLITYWTKDESGHSRYPLLSPIYFCLITPMFYGCMWILGKSFDDEYFFPSLNDGNDSDDTFTRIFSPGVWNIFHIIDFTTISWDAVIRSIPTMLALVMFSLIHVPINIPAFSCSSNVDVDMNVELMAHGWSNGIVGILGGLQNYMAYTQSMIYYRSGGDGKVSSLAVALCTAILFFVGPEIASYMPRCMAGTLLLHCGVDLFVEGCYDSYGQYDYLEYFGIWAIALVMTISGMEAALLAGAISALLTYAIQSVTYPKPIRGSMSGSTLRSSDWNRCPKAFEILDSRDTGRIRILVLQFQGHLFFGNVSLFSDGVKDLVRSSCEEEWPYIVIIDFTLVLGIDSSAAQAIMKLRDALTSQFGIKLSIFVPGSTDGFPCEISLSESLNCPSSLSNEKISIANDSYDNDKRLLARLSGSTVCENLDEALVFAEDALIAMVDAKLLYDSVKQSVLGNDNMQIKSLDDEKDYAIDLFLRKCPTGENRTTVVKFFSYFSRESYKKDEIVWHQGATSDCAKLLVVGDLMATLENEAGTTESISIGSVIGESGLVQNFNRNSTVHVLEDSILYNLSRESWEVMKEKDPRCAHLLYAIVVRYLTLRVQHCSNRIFETRCLPI